MGLACAAIMVGSAVARAQETSIVHALNLDRLQITSLGAGFGHIRPSQVEPTNLVSIEADYGEITPQWRVVVGASYWSSRFRPSVVQQFADSLKKSIIDPTGQATIEASEVTLYDVMFGGELRFMPRYSGEIKPFIGTGIAAHVINAEGRLIKGTFVERSLDDIAAGLFITGGISFKLFSHLGVEGMARGDLLSGFRSTQVRAGATYIFGRVRGATGGGSGSQ